VAIDGVIRWRESHYATRAAPVDAPTMTTIANAGFATFTGLKAAPTVRLLGPRRPPPAAAIVAPRASLFFRDVGFVASDVEMRRARRGGVVAAGRRPRARLHDARAARASPAASSAAARVASRLDSSRAVSAARSLAQS